MSPSEILYGRRLNTIVSWDTPMERVMIRLYMLKEMEQEVNKEKKLKIDQDG